MRPLGKQFKQKSLKENTESDKDVQVHRENKEKEIRDEAPTEEFVIEMIVELKKQRE